MKKSIFFVVFGVVIAQTAFTQTRLTLIEQFSNSSCGPCAAISPAIYNFTDNNPDKTITIAYHTAFPYFNDSMYFENPGEADQRVNYYAIPAVPHSILDGNVFNGSTPNFATGISTTVNNRLAITTKYGIQNTNLKLANGQLTGIFEFTSLNASNSSENLRAHVVVIEKKVLKSSYAASPGANNETEYGYVMRKMMPDANGTTINNASLNAKQSVSINWTLKHIKNNLELRVVTFVQNNTTKEIYQAQVFSPEITPVGISETSFLRQEGFSVHPNPAKDKLTILFDGEKYIETVSISNQLGEKVLNESVDTRKDKVDLNVNLPDGIYYLRVTGNTVNSTRKIVISN